MKPKDYEDKDKVNQFETICKEILNACSEIHPNPIFIPGNVTCTKKFLICFLCRVIVAFGEHKKKKELLGSEECDKCTQSNSKIDEHLYLIGFGGSGPAFQNNKLKWEGYPFNTDKELGEAFASVLTDHLSQLTLLETSDKPRDSIILFTHSGPTQSSTTVDWREPDDTPIYAGSDSIRECLLNPKYVCFLFFRDAIIVNIHGHVHLGFGQGHIGNIPVINPGSTRSVVFFLFFSFHFIFQITFVYKSQYPIEEKQLKKIVLRL
ncbi:hypothetical protein RFI_32611 [Reticulomyxa filosa]|uniref:Calcineurin-like phosphoesterase domain-containing protein n=1 Tax=Reticulomyxa filosa TaxID=46433 RepID=X6LT10_RETFI|nr:hypothetical protein RFI_32611 [Reticulomyxa filosa]|eukprot:ETO04784.1 hypothetical protein RFI_32611 [Reticulomyxa filosa]